MLRCASRLLLISCAIILAACGSGSGSNSSSSSTTTGSTTPTVPTSAIIQGIAASGAPLPQAFVQIEALSSSGTLVTPTGAYTDSNGNFQIAVSTDTKPPYLLKLTTIQNGRTLVLHAINSQTLNPNQASIINITPLTEWIMAEATHTAPETFYNSPQWNQVNSTSVITAESNLRGKLFSLMSAAGLARPDNTNLLHTSFVANHAGIDKVLDLLDMTISPDLTKIRLGNKLVSPDPGLVLNISTGIYTGAMPTGTPANLNLETINALATNLTAAYATAIPTAAKLYTLVASNYLNDGTSAAGLVNLLQDSTQNYIGATFSIESIDNIFTVGGQTRVGLEFLIRHADGTSSTQTTAAAYDTASSSWRLVGNGRSSTLGIAALYGFNYHLDGVTLDPVKPNSVGMLLRIATPVSTALSSNPAIDHAVVTGPGMPVAGVTLQPSLSTACGVLSLSATTCNNRYEFADTSAATFAADFDYHYTVSIYLSPSDPAPARYDLVLPNRPRLAQDNPAQITSIPTTIISGTTTTANPTLSSLANYAGSDLPVYWSRVAQPSEALLSYSIGLEIFTCNNHQLTPYQAQTAGNYADTAGNRMVIFSNNAAYVNQVDTPQYRQFPDPAPTTTLSISGVVKRDLRVQVQDPYSQVYYTSYSDSTTPASCS